MLTSVDPWLGWTAVSIGPISFIGTCVLYFTLDKRYARKDEVERKGEEIARLSGKMETYDEAARGSLEKVRAEMTAGFAAITKTVNDQFISLTKDVATLQGRLAGAAGIDRAV